MKRPLCNFCISCIAVLWIVQTLFPHLIRQDCIERDAEGEYSLMGYKQWDEITLTGTVTQCQITEKEGKTTCLVQLKNVYLTKNLSRSDNILNPQISNSKNQSSILIWQSANFNAQSKKENTVFQITNSGQSIRCYLNTPQELEPGRRIMISGKLSFFSHATNPGEFDVATFYANRDVLFSVTAGEVLAMSKSYNHFLFLMQQVKEELCLQLDKYLPKGEASVMKAMLFGEKK